MKKLDSETDLELMMEFRQTHWDKWTEFCAGKGYEPELEE